jgi:hypothetical protein
MPTESIPVSVTQNGQTGDPVVLSVAGKLLIDMAQLSALTSLGVRTLRRLDASRDIPGRVVVGRRVLFQTEIIREWVRAGLPEHEQWAVLLRRAVKQ